MVEIDRSSGLSGHRLRSAANGDSPEIRSNPIKHFGSEYLRKLLYIE
jgi:hypothetical protein